MVEDSPRFRGLLEANRWLLVGGLAAGTFASIVLVGVFGPVPIQRALVYQDPVDTVFQGLIGGIVTGVTLVLTINQVVISQELGAVGDQRDRMAGAMSFREDVEDATGLAVSPAHPSAFLRALVESTRRKALALDEAVGADAAADGAVRDELEAYVGDIVDNAERVTDQLNDSQFGTFTVLSAALDYNYSRKINAVRRVRNEHGDSLSGETNEAVDDLLAVLKFFGPAREHIKTLYFQWELINLSRAIAYVAIPALVVTFVMIFFFDPGAFLGTTLGVANALWIVGLGLTVATVPFLTLIAYLLRIATIAKRTLAIGPFVLRETDRDEEIRWEDEWG